MFESILQKILGFLVVLSLVASGAAVATENMSSHKVETGQYQQIKGINIYYGLLLAQIAGKHPATHEERTMHCGVPPGKNEYHLIVALYDASGKRITDVTATVGEFGMGCGPSAVRHHHGGHDENVPQPESESNTDPVSGQTWIRRLP